MTKNPNWTRDELILALDLYFRFGRQQLESAHPEVIKLSQSVVVQGIRQGILFRDYVSRVLRFVDTLIL